MASLKKKFTRSSSELNPNMPNGKKRAEAKPNVEAKYDGYAYCPAR
jgi:hypothetical protein